MTAYRDAVRSKQAESSATAKRLGKNVDDVRRESRGSQATGAMITRLANDPTPTQGHERQVADDFVGQVFDGTNTDFTISRRVLGQNIHMHRVDQASGSLIRLDKTTNPAPSANQFWFDDLFTVRVGTPPQPLDALLASYTAAL